MKKCFVISPIGQEASEIREHADDVLQFIIQPAMEELGIQAYRADHTNQLGKITDQMFDSILQDDFCIAILTFHNPNVFYELAIAQSAARPVIILIQKGESIPFDIRDLRCIEYDLKPRNIHNRIYSKKIVEIIRAFEIEKDIKVPFGLDLLPLGKRSQDVALFEVSSDFENAFNWTEFLKDSNEFFNLSGVTLLSWSRSPAFVSVLKQKLKDGCKVRLLLMDPENHALSYFSGGPDAKHSLDKFVLEINLSVDNFTKIAQEFSNLSIKLIRKSCPHIQMAISEKKAMLAPYFFSIGKKDSPLIIGKVNTKLFKNIVLEFEFLWSENDSFLV